YNIKYKICILKIHNKLPQFSLSININIISFWHIKLISSQLSFGTSVSISRSYTVSIQSSACMIYNVTFIHFTMSLFMMQSLLHKMINDHSQMDQNGHNTYLHLELLVLDIASGGNFLIAKSMTAKSNNASLSANNLVFGILTDNHATLVPSFLCALLNDVASSFSCLNTSSTAPLPGALASYNKT
ncbi:hypothetical protein AGLY_001453, partial [Aphis glycines]